MSILSWGKCTISYTTSTNGAPGASAAWTELDTPKEDSTRLTPNAGAEIQATEEGGAMVDFRRAKYTYDLETTLFVKKGGTRPFTDVDGIVSGEYALRIVPEDATCEGIQIDRCVISLEDNYTAADGKTIVLRAKVLKPASGNQVKPYTVTPPGSSD